MRIGILQADNVQAQFRDEFGDYAGMFRSLLENSASSEALEFRVYDVLRGDYPERIGDCDGYVITGSRESVYDDARWIARLADFVRSLHARRHKTVGICFGHQLIAHVLGGKTTAASVGWGVGVHEVRVVDKQPWMDPALPSINLLCSHKDQVLVLPERARVIASSEFCPLAGFALGSHFITFQGHPEFSTGYARALMNSRVELLGDAYEPGIRSLEHDTDETSVGRWMLNFVAG
ncbi:MAG: GMP synthase [Gammaproteobacteria bacterium]|nr:GMP synthase [Gammaproteobacteria bacterium]